MKQTLLCCVLAVAAIQAVRTKGIQASMSGSKTCLLAVRFTVYPISNKYHSLQIQNTHRRNPHYSLRGCKIVSVRLLTGLSRTTSLFDRNLVGFNIAKQDDNILELTIPHRELVHFQNGVKIFTELDCQGRRCVLISDYNYQDIPQWRSVNRKLLGLKSEVNVKTKMPTLPFFSAFFTVAVILVFIVTLALCTCGRKSKHEKTLSDEVGGTDLNQQVIGVSSTPRIEGKRDSELHHNGNTERRSTANSQNSSVFVSKVEEDENVAARTASQSSQQGDLSANITTRLESTSSHSSTKILQASNSHGSIDQIEAEALLTNPDSSAQVGSSEKKRSASAKEHSPTNSESKDSRSLSQSDALIYKDNKGNIATPKKNNSVQLISRKHSDKKDSKENKPQGEGRDDHKGKRNWLRRKSSKNKSNVEVKVSADDMKRSPTPGRHSTIPLPPTPETKDSPSYFDEDVQYEAVEPRPRNAAPLPIVDNNYDSVDDIKRNSKTARNSRPASELYECINDDQSKLMRNSKESPDYDIVETRPKPVAVNSNNLEYAYTVVAQRDNLVVPQETSGGSGLYEVVTDDIKKLSGVTSTQVSIEDTYAVVQKDPSKTKQQTRPLSDTVLAPAPPSVSSLRHVAVSSERQRSQSLGDDLNLIGNDEPSSSSHLLEGSKVEVDHMYAKVNKSLKKRAPDRNKFVGDTVISDGAEDDTPPPIPPSLYAELPMKDEGHHEDGAATNIQVSSLESGLHDVQPATSSNPSSNRNSRGSVTDRNSKTSYDMIHFNQESTKIACQENVVITVSPDSQPKHTSTNTQNDEVNPLYQVIHYV